MRGRLAWEVWRTHFPSIFDLLLLVVLIQGFGVRDLVLGMWYSEA